MLVFVVSSLVFLGSMAWRGTGDEGGFRGSGSDDLELLVRRGYVTSFYGLVSSGKEADVILAYYKDFPLILKRYRIHQTFRKRAAYGLTVSKLGKTRRGLGLITKWAEREYQSLRKCYRARVPVPVPVSRMENVLVLSMIGETEPAPRLKEAGIENWGKMATRIYQALHTMVFKAEIVHGDLSFYNILVDKNHPYLIDFPQSIDLKGRGAAAKARAFLERDLSHTLLTIPRKDPRIRDKCICLATRLLKQYDRHFYLEE